MNHINNGQLDLNLLKVFVALYEEGSASKAAVRLSVTQSAVSAALKRLRLLYDDQLFVRTAHGFQPTSRAQAIKPIISDALDNIVLTVHSDETDGSGYEKQSLIIGLSDDFELAIGPTLIALIQQQAPQLKVVFRQTNSQRVSDALSDKQIDVAITSSYLRSSAIHSDLLTHSNYACLLSKDFIYQADELSLETYLSANHLLISGDGLTGIVDDALLQLGHKRHVSVATTHFSVLPFLLKGENTLATIPTHAAQAISHLFGFHLVACPIVFEDYPVSVSWHKARAKDTLVNDAIQWIKAVFNT